MDIATRVVLEYPQARAPIAIDRFTDTGNNVQVHGRYPLTWPGPYVDNRVRWVQDLDSYSTKFCFTADRTLKFTGDSVVMLLNAWGPSMMVVAQRYWHTAENAAAGLGFALRYIDGQNYIRCWYDTGNHLLKIDSVVAGVVTPLVSEALAWPTDTIGQFVAWSQGTEIGCRLGGKTARAVSTACSTGLACGVIGVGASPVGPYYMWGVEVWSLGDQSKPTTGTVIVDEQFTGDGAVAGRTPVPTNAPGHVWEQLVGDGVNCGTTMAHYYNSSGAAKMFVIETHQPNINIEWDHLNYTGLADEASLVFRCVDVDNYWMLRWRAANPTQLELVKRVTGVETVVDTALIDTPQFMVIVFPLIWASDRFTVVAQGNDIVGYFNGVAVVSTSDVALNAATKHGWRDTDAAAAGIETESEFIVIQAL